MIPADFGELLDQAAKTANQYLSQARRSIDLQFGEGYAAKNPDLVACFMRVAAGDFQTSSALKVMQASFQSIADGLSEIASASRRE